MGNAIAFDTYAYVKKLRDAGLTEQQAAIQAEALVNLIEERLATKADLARTEAALQANLAKAATDLATVDAGLQANLARAATDLAAVDANLRAELAKVEADLRAELAKVEASLRADLAKVEAGVAKVQADVNRVAAELHKMEAELKRDIKALEIKIVECNASLTVKIAESKSETIKWMVSLALAQLGFMTGILITLLRLLPASH